MTDMKIEQIRDEDEYTGLRISLPRKIRLAEIVIKLDISTGDPSGRNPSPSRCPDCWWSRSHAGTPARNRNR